MRSMSPRGPEAMTWTASYRYDLVVLDVVLPGFDGFEVCRRLRAAGFTAPILMLTARDQVEDRVRGLDSGADDYLAKPFVATELLAVCAPCAGAGPRRASRSSRSAASSSIRPVATSASTVGPVRLTAKEFALLEVLARHPGQVFAQDRLIDALWDADFAAGSNIVEVYIHSLRRKIDGGRRDGLIETVRGAGYRIRAGGTGAG